MKLLTYDAGNGARCGMAVKGGGVADVTALLQAACPVRDVQALLELGAAPLAALAACADHAPAHHCMRDVRLLSPILRPPTIRDFSVYEGHASMHGAWQLPEAWYRLPAFYFSNPLCMHGQDATVPFPSATGKFDYELELAAVIGSEVRNACADDAWDAIAGFTIFIDWSCRDLQRDEMQLHLGPAKGKDCGSSLGPWMVTKDEFVESWKNRQLDLAVRMKVNGEDWLTGSTAGMQHDWGELLVRASRDSRLVPGDIVAAGTVNGGSIPEAIRLGKSARYLEPGDRLEATIEGIGTLRSTLGEQASCDASYSYLAPRK
ncbi:fumarylacetoacetate hydrolase family protein [Pigmentiphaga sp. H8]|uniref:fumarylacetoacetate hydrolase family protein n=1 Tax=Pigmentiphaga sp. H8 TaxID=2488560 RepID=UPI0013758A8C|nr:fumarylacetoacetate hydrolase family protein [Pigmentiphaga sp. H8]